MIPGSGMYSQARAECGDSLAMHGRREQIVLATKYTLTSRPEDPNAGGNHRTNLVRTVERSLHRLRTDRVDLLGMHMWDGVTPIDEVIRALDDVVAGGKVLAVGISDTPAWVVSRGVALAELRGWSVPCALQLPYSLSGRDAERELLPMAAGLGMAVLAWGVVGGGVLTGKYASPGANARRYGDHSSNEGQAKAVAAIAETAAACDATAAQVCTAWALARRAVANVIPILGARTADQLQENLAALEVVLPADAPARLDEATSIPLGFPSSFLADEEVVGLIFGKTRELIEC